jgi:hypothetical protein
MIDYECRMCDGCANSKLDIRNLKFIGNWLFRIRHSALRGRLLVGHQVQVDVHHLLAAGFADIELELVAIEFPFFGEVPRH